MALLTPIIAVAVTLMMLVLILGPSEWARGYGASNVFAYHGAFMSVAFCFLMPMGILSYGADLGNKGNAVYPTKSSRRLLHGYFASLAVCFAVSAYLIAFVYHQANGITHLALDQEDKSRTAHVFIGLITLGGLCLQGIVGLWKMVKLTRDGQRTLLAHGKLGPAVWMGGLLCIALAAWFEYQENFTEHKIRWLLPQVIAIWAGLLVLAVAVCVHLYIGSRAHIAPESKALGLGYDEYSPMQEDTVYADIKGVRRGNY